MNRGRILWLLLSINSAGSIQSHKAASDNDMNSWVVIEMWLRKIERSDLERQFKPERFATKYKKCCCFLNSTLLPLKFDYLQKYRMLLKQILKHIGWNLGLQQQKKTIRKTNLLVPQADKLLAASL